MVYTFHLLFTRTSIVSRSTNVPKPIGKALNTFLRRSSTRKFRSRLRDSGRAWMMLLDTSRARKQRK